MDMDIDLISAYFLLIFTTPTSAREKIVKKPPVEPQSPENAIFSNFLSLYSF
jgi:hypothetical protein